eukprot:CAMPEP_0170167690 /NCGR_PEP_ID=MMETSP0040_2-20121228/1026_1 /TAXON_ID=641309 /ORGANISM="Lotharella oceanica, Strain CCMP622" /LENGTH=108 /DNA_ID=CAMNT_0010405793 /DNA_START=182 /DNA_END=508 /DNA_ORIENTATION=-
MHNTFKRDVLIFKTIALVQLAYVFLQSVKWLAKPDFSLFVAILMAAMGYVTSALATVALGVDRTYFGIELGLCKFEYTSAWPYGAVFGGYLPGIPHPMIVGQVSPFFD